MDAITTMAGVISQPETDAQVRTVPPTVPDPANFVGRNWADLNEVRELELGGSR